MNSTNPEDGAPTPRPLVRRRTIAQGMGWAAPVIVAGAPVPAAAASCLEHGSYTQGPGTGSVTIPACVRTVTFTLIAGGGGGSEVDGGDGAKITGSLVLLGTAPTTLTFDIGYGGDGRGALAGSALSGRGYGDGGIGGIRFYDGSWRVDGGDGGGGSAILLGTTPVVVAGGGGGAGNGSAGQGETAISEAGYGGDAGPTPENGTNAVIVGESGSRREMEGGGAASGLTGGTGGDIGVGATAERRLGAPGSNGPGGNGGAGGSFANGDAANAGGGGGGYAGGGGGEAGAFTLDGNDLRSGAGGGAGSSYTGGGGGISVRRDDRGGGQRWWDHRLRRNQLVARGARVRHAHLVARPLSRACGGWCRQRCSPSSRAQRTVEKSSGSASRFAQPAGQYWTTFPAPSVRPSIQDGHS